MIHKTFFLHKKKDYSSQLPTRLPSPRPLPLTKRRSLFEPAPTSYFPCPARQFAASHFTPMTPHCAKFFQIPLQLS